MRDQANFFFCADGCGGGGATASGRILIWRWLPFSTVYDRLKSTWRWKMVAIVYHTGQYLTGVLFVYTCSIGSSWPDFQKKIPVWVFFARTCVGQTALTGTRSEINTASFIQSRSRTHISKENGLAHLSTHSPTWNIHSRGRANEPSGHGVTTTEGWRLSGEGKWTSRKMNHWLKWWLCLIKFKRDGID